MFCRDVFGNVSGGFRGISRFFGNFAGFRGNTWISPVCDRAKYQKPWRVLLHYKICRWLWIIARWYTVDARIHFSYHQHKQPVSLRSLCMAIVHSLLNYASEILSLSPGGSGVLPYKSDWDACRNIQIKPLRETNVGCGCGSSLSWPLREISVWSVAEHFL